MTAKKLGIDTKLHVNNLATEWLDFCKLFAIDFTSFYRTSSAEHAIKVQSIWNTLANKGLIYKKQYVGRYCIGCEAFKSDKELVEDKCQDHPTLELSAVAETNYFFKLSQFKPALLSWLTAHPEFLIPKDKRPELLNLLDSSEDISISRVSEVCPWGVKVPDDDSQTIYVWFDALLNYIIAAGYPNKLEWENAVQICGPDNLRFQAIIFQAFLIALDIAPTKTLLVHGTILDAHGHKQSKTTGNVISPLDQLSKFGLDAVRYYALAGLNTCTDSAWSEDHLIQCFNNEVCNDWGNTVSRVLHLLDTKCGGELIKGDPNFLTRLEELETIANTAWDELQIKQALAKTNDIVRWASAYIDTEKPWNNPECMQIVSNLYYLLVTVNKLYSPVLLNGSKLIEVALINKKKVIAFTKL